MLFNSLIFIFAFLPVAYAVFWALPNAKYRYIWLTITGYVFYGYWNPKFCLLMAFSTLVSYFTGLAILKAQDAGVKRRWHVALPVTVDLLLLGFFKYAGFISKNLNSLFDYGHSTLNLPHVQLPVLDIILPVGISFYTFHTISYIVDAYRGQIRPTKNIFEFSAYVSLFSQLIAGPIVRFRQIEQDLEAIGKADRKRWLMIGISVFVFGLVEKVLLADSLAHYSDAGFTHPVEVSFVQAWASSLAYTFQLYFDFSGYSSMAVGLGYMFALRIPQNFNSPYKSKDPSDFWRRWHISLSTCMRDYLYISFGGNRKGELLTYRNLMLTMLIGGLWHGANWTFILWGAYHGILLGAHRYFAKYWDPLPAVFTRTFFFLLVVLGWVLFKAANVSDAGHVLSAMLGGHGFGLSGIAITAILTPTLLALLLIAALWSMTGPNVFDFHKNYQWKPRDTWRLSLAFGAALAVIVSTDASPFLYFQF